METVLIVCNFFNVDKQVGSKRMTMLAQYLLENGYDVRVITTETKYWGTEIENKELESVISPIRIHFSPWHHWLKKFYIKREKRYDEKKLSSKKNSSFIENKNEKVLQKNFFYKQIYKRMRRKVNLLWCNSFEKYYIKQLTKYIGSLSKNKITVITSTGFNEFEPIKAVRFLLEQGVQLNWISDMRDMFHGGYYNDEMNKIGHELEHFIIESSKFLTVLSYGKKMMLCEAHGLTEDMANKIIPIYTPYMDNYPSNKVKIHDTSNKKLSLVYTGAVYPMLATPNLLLKTINELIEENLIDRNNIIIHYAGKHGALFKLWMSQYHLEDVLNDHGLLSRKEANQLQLKSDIMICLTWNTDTEKGIIPLKLVEYIQNRKPIICIVSGNDKEAEETQIINKLNVGISAKDSNDTSSDYFQLKNYLLTQYYRVQSGEEVEYNGITEEIEKFYYKRQYERFIELIRM